MSTPRDEVRTESIVLTAADMAAALRWRWRRVVAVVGAEGAALLAMGWLSHDAFLAGVAIGPLCFVAAVLIVCPWQLRRSWPRRPIEFRAAQYSIEPEGFAAVNGYGASGYIPWVSIARLVVTTGPVLAVRRGDGLPLVVPSAALETAFGARLLSAARDAGVPVHR